MSDGPGTMDPAQLIRVFVVHDVRLYRESLRLTLGQAGGVEVVGVGASWIAIDPAILPFDPDVVLLGLPTHEGLLAARMIRAVLPYVAVVALGVAEVDADILAWAEAGMSGYVSRQASIEELLDTIRRAVRGEMVCSPRATAVITRRLSALATGRATRVARQALTPREHDIVRLIGQGLSNKEIARRLSIALPTVKNHVHHVLEKLEVRRRSDAVSLCANGGGDWI